MGMPDVQKRSHEGDENRMININLSGMTSAANLPDSEREILRDLIGIYEFHFWKNEQKDKYYEGHVTLADVNLGIALPDGFKGLEVGCEWGAKCVDVLAARSMFDGFVDMNGGELPELTRIVESNNLISEYAKACCDELKYGCTFATLSADGEDGCKIRFHTPRTAAARWSGVDGRIDCGFAIIDTEPDESELAYSPKLVNFHTSTDVWVLSCKDSEWIAERHAHKMGRPLMEPLVWNPTSAKPFGRSRLKASIRHLIEGYVRTIANATIGLEFSTTPQKYLLGITDKQYDAVISDKFKQYVGSILAGTTNPETGEKPSVGQFQQGTLTPHVEMMRLLATQFSAATGLSVTDTGVVNNANPTSADAVIAQTNTLISMAEKLNASNGNSLKVIALMAQAIARNVTLDELGESERDIVAHFRNPAMPSVSSMTDAALKIATARQGFAGTDVFLEMIGFDQADIRRIRAQEQRISGSQILLDEFSEVEQEEDDADITGGVE